MSYSDEDEPSIRICSQCGEETEYEYDDYEWKARDCVCEKCEDDNETEELLALDII
jgi:DNA replicative helicase MCM subunit Mcm2 (Cdc46/Mcm family)